MTRRPMIGLVAVAAVVAIALVYVLASPASPASPTGEHECQRSAGRSWRINAAATGRAATDPSSSPEARALRLRAVLGDERRHRRPSREDAADDPRPLLGHEHQDRQDRHEPDRLQADHRRDRQAAHPRGARPRRGRPARLHQLRDGAQQAPVPVARDPGRDDRGARRACRSDRCRRHQRRRRAARPGISCRPTARSSGGCAKRWRRRIPTASSRWRRPPGRPVRRWPSRQASRGRTASS